MKRILTALAVAALALPAAALAEDPPSPQQRANGARTCHQLRDSLGADTFKLTYGTNLPSRSNAMGKCVSKWAHEQQEAEQQASADCASQPLGRRKRCAAQEAQQQVAQEVEATLNAAKSCKRDRGADHAAFAAKWGSGANAYGKCVSATARKLESQQSSTG